MFTRIFRNSFLILVLIFPQFFNSLKSSNLNESHFIKLSDELLISGWKPSLDENPKRKKPSDKTRKALNNFKKISSLNLTSKKQEVMLFSQT